MPSDHTCSPHLIMQEQDQLRTHSIFLSNMRIYVECAFGEIDRRWGILWKPLQGSLDSHKYTIDSCLRLHNFIVNYREQENESDEERGFDLASEREELNVLSDQYMFENMYGEMGAVLQDCKEEELRRRGRPTSREARLRSTGNNLRS